MNRQGEAAGWLRQDEYEQIARSVPKSIRASAA
jgi:hypothetical protein